MVNCCIHRCLQNVSETGESKVITPVKRAGNLFDHISRQEHTEDESTASKFQSLIERFVEGDTNMNQRKDLEVLCRYEG